MFACQNSSPMAQVRFTCQSAQTMLDAHCQPRSKAVIRDTGTGAEASGAPKGGNKDRNNPHKMHAEEDNTSSTGDASVNGPPKCMVCDASEGKAFLEVEDIIKAEGILDINMLVEVLIHISALEGMLPLASNAVRVVAFLLDE